MNLSKMNILKLQSCLRPLRHSDMIKSQRKHVRDLPRHVKIISFS